MSPEELEQLNLGDLRQPIYLLQIKEKFTDEDNAFYAELIKYSQTELIQTAAKQLNLILDETNREEFLYFFQQIINLLAPPEGIAPNLPPDLAERVEEHQRHLAQKRQEEAARKGASLSLEEQIRLIQKKMMEKAATPELIENPPFFRDLTHQIAKEVVTQIPELTAEEDFEDSLPFETYQTQINRIVREEFARANLKPPSEKITTEIAQATRSNAKEVSLLPHPVSPVIPEPRTEVPPTVPYVTKEISVEPEPTAKAVTPVSRVTRKVPVAPKAPAKALFPPSVDSLPQEVIDRLETKPEGNAFRFISRGIPSPKAIIAKHGISDKETISEFTRPWQLMAQGIFAEDVQASLNALEEAGLRPDHRLHQWLRITRDELLAEQKIETVLADGTVVTQDRPLVKVFKRHFEPLKKQGKLQVKDPETGFYFPRLSPEPVKSRLQLALNRFALRTRLYRKVVLGPGKTVLRPAITPIRIFIRKIYTRAIITLRKVKLFRIISSKAKIAAAKLAAKWGAKKTLKKGAEKAALIGAEALAKKTALSAIPVVGQVLGALSLAKDGLKLLLSKLKAKSKDLESYLARKSRGVAQGILDFGEKAFLGVTLIVSAAIAGLGALTLPTILPLIGVLVIPLVIFLTLFNFQIIDNAFIVPGIAAELEYPQSRYVEVIKTAAPGAYTAEELEGIWDSGELANVTYEITITATEDDITITDISDTFSVYPTGPTIPSAETGVDLPLEIPAGGTETYTYQLGFDSSYLDSVVTNRIIVTADVADGPNGEQSSDVASVLFGEPPTLCFVFDGNWNETDMALELSAINYLSQWPHFVSLLCPEEAGPISLERGGTSQYGGWAPYGENRIVIYDLGLGSFSNTLYTLAHESGHLIDYRNSYLRWLFREMGVQTRDGNFCSYGYGFAEHENFAEMIGVYPVWEIRLFNNHCPDGGNMTCGYSETCHIDYPNDFPAYYDFANDQIFNP